LALREVAREVTRALSFDAEEKRVSVAIQVEPDAVIEADGQLLRQLLFNLLLNAIQAVDAGGAIVIAAGKGDAGELWCEVRDDGPGVPEERRQEIFKPYFTAQKSGTGLGLAVVRQIARTHGWEVACLANSPRGAIFRVEHLKRAAPPPV
jgi:two-component system sensor histidine kinase AtoS